MTEKSDRSWPDARDDLARVVSTTTPSQRLEWLEEMLDLAHTAGAMEKARQLERMALTEPDPAPPAPGAGSFPKPTSGSDR